MLTPSTDFHEGRVQVQKLTVLQLFTIYKLKKMHQA